MGVVNQASNLIDRIVRVEKRLNEIWKKVGLTSAVIRRGGLTLLEGSFLKMEDENGIQRLYIGGHSGIPLPDGSPQPVFMMRDGENRMRLAMYDPDPSDGYEPVVWIWDHLNHVAFTTDRNGGVAEPWISVPLYARAFPNAFLDSTGTHLTLPVSACNGSDVWEGRIGKVSHPRIQLDFVHGRVSGSSGVPTYRFYVGNTLLRTWSETGYGSAIQGPFDISDYLGQHNVPVRITCSATGTGTDRVALAVNGCWMRQT